jgi:Zn-finger nucleic acid-binding protein
MLCPVCKIVLHQIEYEQLVIEQCQACEGRWLDAGELRTIVQKREAQHGAAERKAAAKRLRAPALSPTERERKIACPGCGTTTQPVNYGGDSGIIVNRCPACGGVWLDRCELESIQALVEGLDDAASA